MSQTLEISAQPAGLSSTGRVVLVASGLLFFASGAAALLYQLAWQRALFGWYGVDLDSVSAIVSIFMLGLGGGALVGGWLADRFPRRRLVIFAAIEACIGLFGLISLPLIDQIGATFATFGLPVIVMLTFALFMIPTCAMGATLPVLVTELTARRGNVGAATGVLYFINTLGAAFGALCGGLLLIGMFGIDGMVIIAAFINLVIAAVAAIAVWAKL